MNETSLFLIKLAAKRPDLEKRAYTLLKLALKPDNNMWKEDLFDQIARTQFMEGILKRPLGSFQRNIKKMEEFFKQETPYHLNEDWFKENAHFWESIIGPFLRIIETFKSLSVSDLTPSLLFGVSLFTQEKRVPLLYLAGYSLQGLLKIDILGAPRRRGEIPTSKVGISPLSRGSLFAPRRYIGNQIAQLFEEEKKRRLGEPLISEGQQLRTPFLREEGKKSIIVSLSRRGFKKELQILLKHFFRDSRYTRKGMSIAELFLYVMIEKELNQSKAFEYLKDPAQSKESFRLEFLPIQNLPNSVTPLLRYHAAFIKYLQRAAKEDPHVSLVSQKVMGSILNRFRQKSVSGYRQTRETLA